MLKTVSVEIDPFASLNDSQMADALVAIINGFKAGDQVIANAMAAYQATTDTRIEDLEALIELAPEHVEDAFKKLLADPALVSMLSGSLSKIPGSDVSIGSFCAALKAAPEGAKAQFQVNDSGEFIGANVTLSRDGVETVVPFTPVTTGFDEDADGFNEKEVQTWTGEAYGLVLSFSFTASVRRKLLGAGFAPLTLRVKTGYEPMRFDLSGFFSVVPVTPVVEPIDVDGDGQIGTAAPAPAPAPEEPVAGG